MATLDAWYHDGLDGDPTGLHQTNPPQFLTVEELRRGAGVGYQRIENCHDPEVQRKLAEGYLSTDIMDMCPEFLGPDYKEKIAKYCLEHLHEDAEIRLVLAGKGYFDVRTYDDRWVRVYVKEGDLLSLPPGIYHRLTLDDEEYIKFYRLFSEVPAWKAYYRPEGDSHPSRAKFLATQQTPVPVA